jgi:hypothetical protein
MSPINITNKTMFRLIAHYIDENYSSFRNSKGIPIGISYPDDKPDVFRSLIGPDSMNLSQVLDEFIMKEPIKLGETKDLLILKEEKNGLIRTSLKNESLPGNSFFSITIYI